jgi:anti-anti-sigma regulatory factor
MKKAEVMIANNSGIYKIKVIGRATFECAPPLRSLAKDLADEEFKKIIMDLSSCTAMDSTFMGILAMLGLRARKIAAEMVILNAGSSNIALIEGLGLKKLFTFTNDLSQATRTDEWRKFDASKTDRLDTARTVLEAHDTLMGVDSENVKKFEKVVNMVKKDVDRLSHEEDK